ncbi:uncharacterized protein [Dysidea avara]|uniref:uncharacterized protein isoform X2 n=1 Tax=Dysidea avara TaxID=196820 RepID=UPI00331F0C11
MAEEEKLSDPVEYLKQTKERCPDVVYIFTTRQVKLLSQTGNESYDPKDVNQEFLSDYNAWASMKQRVDQSRQSLRRDMLTPHNINEPIAAEDFLKQTEVLNEVEERLKKIINLRLKNTEDKHGEVRLPRVVRLCRKFNFSKNETEITLFTLTMQAGIERETRYGGYGIDPISLCSFLDIPLQEVLDFLDQERLHMQQGFFPDIQHGYILSSNLSYDTDVCKALMGVDLKQNGFLKIEQTHLADVIAEEPEHQHLRDQTIDDKSKKPDEWDATGEVRLLSPQQSLETEDPNRASQGGEAEDEKEEKKKEEDIQDLDQLLRSERLKEQERKDVAEPEEEETQEDTDPDKLKPYKKDLEYLDDHFQYVCYVMKVKQYEQNYDDGHRDARNIRQKREAESKCKVQQKKCEKRLSITRQSANWVPRLERMVQSRHLTTFEKNIILLLIAAVIQPNKFQSYEVRVSARGTSVGELLRLFCTDLEEEIAHRKYFYKSATLVREGMISVHNSGLTGDTNNATVEIDRRMLDFCVGLDTEFSEVVEGSHLYFPKTKFEQVVLSKEQKQLIYDTVSNFEAYKRCRKRLGLDDAITYGAGMVLLFHGLPGTGKTMMANALANKLSKKVLLINFPSLGGMAAGENFKFIFREAKINDAILFFDECEAIFETREHGGHNVNLLLTEVERHDGLIIMATNRPFDLDEAMHRRITIALEFRQPDHLLRKAIWESHIPAEMKMAEDVDLHALSLRYELTGGFIKNAILSALSIAVSRDGETPLITQDDLLKGASLQLRGRLRMKDFHRRVVPAGGLDEVVVEERLMKQLKEIVQFEKARSILFGQWGFGKRMTEGLTVLLHGAPGTGKTLAAEAIGYEVGKPLKVINCGELLSKWVGESTKNIDSIFEEARGTDAILVFDEAEGLFGTRTDMSTSTDRYANVDVGVLLYHIERFPGIVILTTNLIDNIDKAFFRRLKFVLLFEVPPRALRERLWKLILPPEAPVADDVDFTRLATYEVTGGSVKSAVFRAASRAALREEDKRTINHNDLESAIEEEINKNSSRTGFRRQDSDASRMYN